MEPWLAVRLTAWLLAVRKPPSDRSPSRAVMATGPVAVMVPRVSVPVVLLLPVGMGTSTYTPPALAVAARVPVTTSRWALPLAPTARPTRVVLLASTRLVLSPSSRMLPALLVKRAVPVWVRSTRPSVMSRSLVKLSDSDELSVSVCTAWPAAESLTPSFSDGAVMAMPWLVVASAWLLLMVSVLRSARLLTYRSPRVVSARLPALVAMAALLLPTLPCVALRLRVLPEVTREFRLPSSTRWPWVALRLTEPPACTWPICSVWSPLKASDPSGTLTRRFSWNCVPLSVTSKLR